MTWRDRLEWIGVGVVIGAALGLIGLTLWNAMGWAGAHVAAQAQSVGWVP